MHSITLNYNERTRDTTVVVEPTRRPGDGVSKLATHLAKRYSPRVARLITKKFPNRLRYKDPLYVNLRVDRTQREELYIPSSGYRSSIR